MCLEEMLVCDTIKTAYMYYGEIRRREQVELTDSLRDAVKSTFAEMHGYYRRGHTPRVKMTKSCNACSMKDICLPKLPKSEQSVEGYILKHIADDVAEGDF
jgi:CRISPR-associated exonuclease Cas4